MDPIEIETQVRSGLVGTPYAASVLKTLEGGITNFIYRATLETPLSDGTTEVVIKHGKDYAAQLKHITLSLERCRTEEECLRYFSQLPPVTSPSFIVRTPKLYHFNQENNTQVQEYLTEALSLKHYAIKNWAAPTPESLKFQCHQLGRSIGSWLRAFHHWGDQPEQKGFRDMISRGTELRSQGHRMTYGSLDRMVDENIEILGDARDVFQQLCDQSWAELLDKSKHKVVHGDFWTGNVLIPDVPIKEGDHTPIWVVDWESSQLGRRPLELGQMLAELWQLKLYKDIDAGPWIIEGLVAAYGGIDEETAFRAILHVGVHLICFGSRTPGWGTTEQNKQLLQTGKDVIFKAWRRDRAAFEGHALGCLFGGGEHREAQ